MAIIAIFGSANHSALEKAIKDQFPADHLHIGRGEWLIATKLTTKEVSDALGITKGDVGSAFVALLASYYGRQPTTTWEWVKSKWEGVNAAG